MTDQTNREAVLALLKSARKILEKPEAWTKYTYARDAEGEEVSPDSQSAVCFCSWGALRRAAHIRSSDGDNQYLLVITALRQLSAELQLPGNSIPAFNDSELTQHADVLNLFDAAISSLEASK